MIAFATPDNRIDALPLGVVVHGDALAVLKTMADNSVDAIVTDPPSSIHFMGREWDSNKGGRDQWVAWLAEIMREAMRCLRPGGHALVWALPRTSHWTALALEDAGFEVRDCVYHLFGSGFPKSTAIDKQIDKRLGAEREVIGRDPYYSPGRKRTFGNGNKYGTAKGGDEETAWMTAPATPEAAQWDGWGTALKPAVECWWLCRKPIDTSPQRVKLTTEVLATWEAKRCDHE